MPIGKPEYCSAEGNILLVEKDAYGFFECKITSPRYLEHPILQRKIKTASGLRTVAGLGTMNWYNILSRDEKRYEIRIFF